MPEEINGCSGCDSVGRGVTYVSRGSRSKLLILKQIGM